MSEKLSVGLHRFIIGRDDQPIFFEAERYDDGVVHERLAKKLEIKDPKGGVCGVLWDFDDTEMLEYNSGAKSIPSATKEEFTEALSRGRKVV